MRTHVLPVAVLALVALGIDARGQAPAAAPGALPDAAWRPLQNSAMPTDGVIPAAATVPIATPPGSAPPATLPVSATPPAALPAAAPPARPPMRVSAGSGTLPNEAGQVWREYDISPYTARVTTTRRPEQTVVDWILRETGYEAWHGEPLAVLSVTPRTLRVYHTPKMQATVAELVERFVAAEAQTRTFSLRIATVDNPNWRARAQRLLRPVSVRSAGVGAWLMPKEEAAILLADLQRRTDYREHSSASLLVNNAQSTVISALRGRTYVRDVTPRPDIWPGFEGQPGQVDEGFSMEFSPLLAVDGRMADAMIKCEIDQVEKLVPVVMEIPTASARQRAKIEVPQTTQFRFQERFRWPADQVLLLGLGMVALPVPIDGKATVAGLPLPLPSSPPRADLLVFVETKGPVSQTPGAAAAIPTDARAYTRRYDSVSPR